MFDASWILLTFLLSFCFNPHLQERKILSPLILCSFLHAVPFCPLLVLFFSFYISFPNFLFLELSHVNVDIEGNNILLSAKYSLIYSAELLPSDISQIQPNSVVHVSNCSSPLRNCSSHFFNFLLGTMFFACRCSIFLKYFLNTAV